MMQNLHIKIFIIPLLFLLHINASVSDMVDGLSDIDGDNGGQSVAKFLTIPISARQLALGGLAAVPDDNSATAVFSAPAISAFFSKYQFAYTHQEWIWGLRKEYLGANFPLLDWGTAGISAQMFTLGKFENARDIDENPVDPKFIEYMITASYGKQLIHEKLAIGINLSYLESRLDQIAGRALSTSFNAIFRYNTIFQAGLYIRNLGTDLEYSSTKESQPLQAGLNAKVSPFLQGPKINPRGLELNFALGILKTIDEPLEIAAGLEFKPIRQFTIRAGYDYYLGRDDYTAGISAGLGLDVKNYGIDAAFKMQPQDFSPVWSATIRYATEEIIPKTAEDFYRVANRFYRRDKYRTTIYYAQKALKLNPNMWKAHSLIANAIAAKHREAGTEIALIYTANINDQYASLPVNGASLGGLARHLTKIKEIREKFETCITLDGGNFIGAKTSRQKAEFSQAYLKAAGYDIFGAGKNEVIFSSSRAGLAEKQITYLCTDCKATKNLFTVDTVTIRKGNYRIAILNVNSSVANKTDLQQRMLEIVRITQIKDISSCNLRIIMIDDSWENIRYYAQNIPLADIILCSSQEQKFETPIKLNNSVILSPGQSGHYLGLLAIRFDKNKKFKSYINSLIPITNDIIGDPLITQLVEGQKRDDGQADENLILSEEMLKELDNHGVFAFLSDRKGNAGIYLKVIDKMAEFPLSDSTLSCSAPLLSFKNRSLTYLVKDSIGTFKLHTMRITGEDDTIVNFPGSVKEYIYSHDQKWLYAAVEDTTNMKTDIYRIKPGDDEAFLVVDWKDGTEKDINFSNDGANMLFISDRDGRSQVYISDPDGKTPLRLTDTESENIQPKFSPNTHQIAYLSDRGNLKGRKDLWIYNRETGKTSRLTRDANISSYIWFDNKGTLLYSAGVNLQDMNTLNIFTGSNEKFIISDTKKDYSELNPRKLFYKGKEFILYSRAYNSGKKEVWLCNPDGTGDRKAVLDNGNNWLK